MPGFNRRLTRLAPGLSLALPLSLGLPLVAGAVSAQTRPAIRAFELEPAPLAQLPAAPPPIGLPKLQNQVSCPALQQRVQSVLGGEAGVWSVTIADGRGQLLADVNGLRPRVPASNTKLVSTAYALDRLGPDYRLATRLWRLPDGSLRLTGEGDPDLALPQLQRLTKLAMGSGGSSGEPGSQVRLQVAEEPKQAWWPQGWSVDDRYYAYGAPITRLAVTSNAIHDSVLNPPSRLQTLMQRSASQQGGSLQVVFVAANPVPAEAVLLHQENSAPMHNLLSLANTESHNFTAEVLMRQAAGTWNLAQAQQLTTQWLAQQGVPMQGVRVADGSGLDRTNRLTSRSLTALLLRMDQHPYGRNYLASMAVAGQRGTLRNLYKGTPLQGQFFGKTGTLRGVRSISGVLLTSSGPRYVSAISNGAGNPNTTIGQVLRQAQQTQLCPV